MNMSVIDFIARLEQAWDGRGEQVFAPPREHIALLMLAGVHPNELQTLLDKFGNAYAWALLPPDIRRQLIFAARRAVELGRQCAWAFGEGEGARL
ncbi:MAG: hypothetical protein ACRETD_03090 [Steroidobacteraceae bacterium]